MFEEEPGLVTVVVVEVPRSGRTQARSQQLWCHARCLAARLHRSAVFDVGSFEDPDAVDKEEAETALGRAADDGWPPRDDEQYGPR